jgi:hemoglobin
MKMDIQNRADIEKLVNAFYEKVIADQLIGHIFTEVVRINWGKHLPLMYDFWDNILFYSEHYDGNPMLLHEHLSKITHLEKKHFRRWNKLFVETVTELYAGENAERVKQKAISISAILQQSVLGK